MPNRKMDKLPSESEANALRAAQDRQLILQNAVDAAGLGLWKLKASGALEWDGRRLLQRLDGDIDFTSEKGAGSCFRVHLKGVGR